MYEGQFHRPETLPREYSHHSSNYSNSMNYSNNQCKTNYPTSYQNCYKDQGMEIGNTQMNMARANRLQQDMNVNQFQQNQNKVNNSNSQNRNNSVYQEQYQDTQSTNNVTIKNFLNKDFDILFTQLLTTNMEKMIDELSNFCKDKILNFIEPKLAQQKELINQAINECEEVKAKLNNQNKRNNTIQTEIKNLSDIIKEISFFYLLLLVYIQFE